MATEKPEKRGRNAAELCPDKWQRSDPPRAAIDQSLGSYLSPRAFQYGSCCKSVNN
jgi:hypothetical protein